MNIDIPTHYEIRVKGHLDDALARQFDGLVISNAEGGEAVISGRIQDQAALQGVLNQIANLGLALISVNAVSSKDPV
jgi:hypothetical protein